ncbi:unnamed protein product [Auanema sp. JU1783]|nr:unnamed protein product [Auanema sp. JU1783]
MRPNRSSTQTSESSPNVKKHSGSSGSAEQNEAAAVPRVSPTTLNNERSTEAFLVRSICKPLRKIVSQNRRRHQTDGFDLDLSYITDRIIAMGYPADTAEAVYRNSMNDTREFLEKNHKDHYKVFNLRGLYAYDPSKFHNRVRFFEMTDHHPPRLEIMAPFCREVHEYLEADPLNVVAVHCKAGKGRTGVMICAYLVYINFYPSPRQNMDYYSIVRTKNNKGVTIPSQRRYVYYFSHLRKHSLNYMPHRIELIGVYFEKIPNRSALLSKRSGFELLVSNMDVDVFRGDPMWLTNEQWNEEEECWNGNVVPHGGDHYDPITPVQGNDVISRRAWGWTVPPNKRVFLEGDVRVNLHTRTKRFPLNSSKGKLGHVWFNTMFSCPGFCGSVYRHGDEAHPYPDGATTIAERKTQPHRPKTGSTSLPNSPPVTDAASRNSEPHIDHNAEERISSRKLDRKSGKDKDRPSSTWNEDMELMLPPGLDRHCPKESLELLYGRDKSPPRVRIEEMLREAHQKDLIQDSYNNRRLSVPQEGNPVSSAPEGRPNASGPYLIRRAPEEHVQVFSVLEIDRACKKNIEPGFQMIIVTRCLRPEDQPLAEIFTRLTYEKQAEKDKIKQEKTNPKSKKLQGVDSGASLGVEHEIFDSTLAKTGTGSGLSTDPRRSDPFLSRYFHRQREDSVSVYPGLSYRCPLLPQQSCCESVELAKSPSEDKPSCTDWEAGCTEYSSGDMNELDIEVRSYHPDAGDYQSGSSRSSSSSDGCAAPADG